MRYAMKIYDALCSAPFSGRVPDRQFRRIEKLAMPKLPPFRSQEWTNRARPMANKVLRWRFPRLFPGGSNAP